MSFHKMFSALCLASMMVSGCGPEPAQSDRDSVNQALRGDGWSNSNYNQLYGSNISDGSRDGLSITGLYYSGGQWYLSTISSLTYAQVTAISYKGKAVAPQNLSTSQGSFQILGSQSALVQDSGSSLILTVGAPLSGTLRLTAALVQADGSFARYTGQWTPAGSAVSATLCPHPVLNADGQVEAQSAYTIPIGGARWGLNGSRANDANAIALTCTHDALGGCIDWGYGPWGTRMDEGQKPVSMALVHQACTRMKRDDFCGTGSPVTTGTDPTDGTTTIHVKDRVGIHPDTNQTNATMEAFWDENGASCFNVSQYRSTNDTFVQRMNDTIATCPNRNVACTSAHTKVLLSARPCQESNDEGDCTAN